MQKTVCMLTSLLLAPLPSVQAQDVHFLVCPEVHFYDESCPLPQGPHVLPPPPPPRPPLFPPETLARDTPPLMRQLLEQPTRANAEAFLRWQAERHARIVEVQTLLHSLQAPPRAPERE